MLFQEIYNWLVYTGGICPTNDNHFGGPPGIDSKLKLIIQQRPSELAACINFFIDKKISGECLDYYAEIGACSGGTTYSMYNFLNFKELLIIDDNGAQNPAMYIEQRGDLNRSENLKGIPRTEIIGASSDPHIVYEAIKASNTHKYDILFIDGDHSYEGVKLDTINYLPIVRKGGYIVFHDTACVNKIKTWLAEMSFAIPTLKKVAEFHHKDEYTSAFPNGIGLTIYQKE